MKPILLIYMLVMGSQLFLVKLCSKHLSWQTLIIFVWCMAFAIILPFAIMNGNIKLNPWVLVAVFAGVLAAIGTIIMYQFIKKIELGVFVPVLSLVPVISVILSIFILHEPMTIKKAISIVLSCIVVFLINT